MADWARVHEILNSAERTVRNGIAVAHTLTTPEFIELSNLLLDARYEEADRLAAREARGAAVAKAGGKE